MSFLKRHSFLAGLAVVLVLFGAVTAGNVARRSKTAEATPPVVRHVTLISVAEYAKDKSSVSAEGKVESLEQAILRSQVNAPVSRVYVGIGNKVSRGQLLVALQNADIAAQLAQAEAGLKAQEARLAEVRKGARQEDLDIRQSALTKAKQDLQNIYDNLPIVLNDAYAKADDAIRKQLAPLYSDGDDISPQLTFQVKDSQTKIDAESGRSAMNDRLKEWQKDNLELASSPDPFAAEAAIGRAKSRLSAMRAFLNQVTDAVQAQIYLPETTAEAYGLRVSTAKTLITGASGAVNAEEQKIAAQKIAIDQSTSQLALARSGATSEQILAQEAAVDQARASVAGLAAQLAKTYIRAPIAGTVSDVPVRVGELLTVGSPVLSIVNVSGLQVKAFVSDYDRERLSEGAEVLIEENIPGRVARISPSLDPENKKVQIDVLVEDAGSSKLVIGQSVNLRIGAAEKTSAGSFFLVPIQAVQVTPEGSFVYFVNENSTLVRHSVRTGRVVGESVEIEDDLAPEMKIVSSVQELRDGQSVIVD